MVYSFCQIYLRDNKQACYKEDFTLAGKIKNQNKKSGTAFHSCIPIIFMPAPFF